MIKKFFVDKLTFVGSYKRFLVAVRDSMLSVRSSYSQYQEDKFILSYLKKFNLGESIYLDIGANHPTDISNTYLMYRHGFHGVVVEPNEELVKLFRRFRKRDIPLMVGCSNSASVLSFHISKTPVISSFSNSRDVNVHRSLYIPVLPVDTIMEHIPYSFINLLSIDVEGLIFEVLEGATNTIKKSLLICLEYDTENDKEKFKEILGTEFEVLNEFGCNLIFVNKTLLKTIEHRQP